MTDPDGQHAAALLAAVIVDQLDAADLARFDDHFRVAHAGDEPFLLGSCGFCLTAVVRCMNLPDGGVATRAQVELLEYVITLNLLTPAPQPEVSTLPPVGDVLDAVDADGVMLCSCGCGQQITDRSPSAYFAYQECSERWHATRFRQVPGPDRRGATTVRQPQTTPAGASVPATAWLDSISPEIAATAVIVFDGDDVTITIPPRGPLLVPQSISYTRQCPRCRAVAEPVTVAGPSPAHIVVPIGYVKQVCPACSTRLPGRAYFARTVFFDPPHTRPYFRCELDNGVIRCAEGFIPVEGWWRADAHAAEQTAQAAGRMWRRLERRLDEFDGGWQPAAGRDRDGGEPHEPYEMTFPPPPPRFRLLPPWRTPT